MNVAQLHHALFLTGVLLGAAGCIALALLIGKSLLSDLWKFLFLAEFRYRIKSAQVFFGLSTIPASVVYLTVFPGYNLDILFFLILTTAPTFAWYATTFWAWQQDDIETRQAALVVAAEHAERDREPVPRIDQRLPWRGYIFDVETARRRAAYEPPPI